MITQLANFHDKKLLYIRPLHIPITKNAAMMKKLYNILLDNREIGTTELEKADTPMGVVFGQINLINIISGYDFFKTYCLINDIEMTTDNPDERLINTANIPDIKVINPNGIEIKGVGTNIESIDTDTFSVTIIGISYPFFEEEFPHHVKAYNNSLKDN